MNMPVAKSVLESGVLFSPDRYSLKALFQIRDALYILDKWNLADLDLLKEVEEFIAQKEGVK